MEGQESLKDMNMGKLWSLARARGIDFKGMKKKELIEKIISTGEVSKPEKKEVKPTEKKVKVVDMVEVTLKDGTKAKVPAENVTASVIVKPEGTVIIKSVDGRELEASVGREIWVGKEIEVPVEYEEEVRRLLKSGGFYFV